MGKRKVPSSRQGEEEVPRREGRSKKRHDVGSTSQARVNPNLGFLFKNENKAKLFREKFSDRKVLAYKSVNFTDLTKMYEIQ